MVAATGENTRKRGSDGRGGWSAVAGDDDAADSAPSAAIDGSVTEKDAGGVGGFDLLEESDELGGFDTSELEQLDAIENYRSNLLNAALGGEASPPSRAPLHFVMHSLPPCHAQAGSAKSKGGPAAATPSALEARLEPEETRL